MALSLVRFLHIWIVDVYRLVVSLLRVIKMFGDMASFGVRPRTAYIALAHLQRMQGSKLARIRHPSNHLSFTSTEGHAKFTLV